MYGLPCGLYIEAFTPVGDPADITAQISFLYLLYLLSLIYPFIVSVDNQGGVKEAVGEIVTEHEGRGKTIFTPRSGEGIFVKLLILFG